MFYEGRSQGVGIEASTQTLLQRGAPFILRPVCLLRLMPYMSDQYIFARLAASSRFGPDGFTARRDPAENSPPTLPIGYRLCLRPLGLGSLLGWSAQQGQAPPHSRCAGTTAGSVGSVPQIASATRAHHIADARVGRRQSLAPRAAYNMVPGRDRQIR